MIVDTQSSSPKQQAGSADLMSWLPRPIRYATALLLLIIAVGVVGYMVIEGWSAWDALWMIFITLTTIGYGEVHPLSDGGRLWTVALIISGVSVGTYALTRITALLVEGTLLDDIRFSRRSWQMTRLSNHYIIVGAGRLGMSVIDEVTASGGQVCVIERDPERIAALSRRGLLVIQGDGSNDDVLREAGIARAQGMAVAVPSGAEAIFVTLSARHLSPDLPISTRASDQEEALKARRAGATSVVSPFRMGGWRMAHGLIRPDTSNFLDLATLAANDELLIDELLLKEGCRLVGQTLGALGVRREYGVLVVAIRRASGQMLAAPDGDVTLEVGDVLIVVGRSEGVRALAQAL
ncbi:MAG: voltage-gated potassium channel [Myxococcota bacterium]|jgi:voltage-gated potassium channel